MQDVATQFPGADGQQVIAIHDAIMLKRHNALSTSADLIAPLLKGLTYQEESVVGSYRNNGDGAALYEFIFQRISLTADRVQDRLQSKYDTVKI